MEPEPAVAIGVASDQGKQRTENQDSVATPPLDLPPDELSQKGVLCLVADGIGGHRAGKQASELVARRVMEEYYRHPPGDVPRALRRAIRIANAEVFRLAQEPGYEKMGTTIVAAVLHGETLTVAHVGDSRAYLLAPDHAQALTRDHTWVTEQLENGILTQEQADKHLQRHVLTRSLGARPEVLIDLIQTSLRAGDQVLLCSDGLWETVGLSEIEAIARGAGPRQAAKRLVELANEYGGPDNVSVVVARPALGPANPASPPPKPGVADRLGRTLARIVPAEGGPRWPLLAAAALLLVLALACALAILLGGLLPEDEAAPTAAGSATPGVVTQLPESPVTAAPAGQPTAAQATAAPTSLPTSGVTVTGTAPVAIQGRVVATVPLALRQEPRLQGALVAYLTSGSSVTISCRAPGDVVEGDDTWYRVTVEGGSGGYVAALWIEPQGVERAAVPPCSD